MVRTVKTNFEQYIKLNKKVPAEQLAMVAQIDEPAKLADTVASQPVGEDRRPPGAS
ncbi:MAG: hypothetical protein WDM81_20585 [Rhizomicrobium sp.]